MELNLLCTSDNIEFKSMLVFNPNIFTSEEQKGVYELYIFDSNANVQNDTSITTNNIVIIFPELKSSKEFPKFLQYIGETFILNSTISKNKLFFIQELLDWQGNQNSIINGFEYISSQNSGTNSILLFTMKENVRRKDVNFTLSPTTEKIGVLLSSAALVALGGYGINRFMLHPRFVQKKQQALQAQIDDIVAKIPDDNLRNQNLKTYAKNLKSFNKELLDFTTENKYYFSNQQRQTLLEVQETIREEFNNLASNFTGDKIFEKLKTNYKTAASKTNLLKTDLQNDYERYLIEDFDSLDKNILNLYKSANALGLKEIITTTQLDGIKYEKLQDFKKFMEDIEPILEYNPLSTLAEYYGEIKSFKPSDDNEDVAGLLLKILEFSNYVINPFNINIGELQENIKNYLNIDTEFEKGDINLDNIDFNLETTISEEYNKFTSELMEKIESLINEESKLKSSWRFLSRSRHNDNINDAKQEIKNILGEDKVEYENLKTEYADYKESTKNNRKLNDVAKDIVNYLEKNNLTLKDVRTELKNKAAEAEINSNQLVKDIREILQSRETLYNLIAQGFENSTISDLQDAIGHLAINQGVIEEEVQEYIKFLVQDTKSTELSYVALVKGSIEHADIDVWKTFLLDSRNLFQEQLGIDMKNVFRYLPKILKQQLQNKYPDLVQQLEKEILNVEKEV